MADWTLMTLQLRGKTRRFVQSSLLRQDLGPLLAKRKGECTYTFEAQPSPGRAVVPEPALE